MKNTKNDKKIKKSQILDTYSDTCLKNFYKWFNAPLMGYKAHKSGKDKNFLTYFSSDTKIY